MTDHEAYEDDEHEEGEVIEGDFGGHDDDDDGDGDAAAHLVDGEPVASIFEDLADVYTEPIPLDEDVFRPTSLNLDVSEMSFREFARLGIHIQRIEHGIQFWGGDWYNLGEGRWGEEIHQLLDGYSLKTVGNWAWVCEKIPADMRMDDLSWTHHKYAADLPTRPMMKKALREASEKGWTTEEMRAYVQSKKKKDDSPDRVKERGATTSVTFELHWNLAVEDEAAGDEIAEALETHLRGLFEQFSIQPRSVSSVSKTHNESTVTAAAA